MKTNVSDADELGSTAISLEKKWCPKCAAFQLASNSTCEKCGASMSRLKASAPLSLAAKCATWILALILAILLIGAFHLAGFMIVGVFALLFMVGWCAVLKQKDASLMSPEDRAKANEKAARDYQARNEKRIARLARADNYTYGVINPKLICPHCQTQGKVRTKQVECKVGISGGKATAAVLTGGLSVLATGLSRKQQLTAARCGECFSVWQF